MPPLITMATTPEEFFAAGLMEMEPSPPSPSINLPLMPDGGGQGPLSDDDLVLSYMTSCWANTLITLHYSRHSSPLLNCSPSLPSMQTVIIVSTAATWRGLRIHCRVAVVINTHSAHPSRKVWLRRGSSQKDWKRLIGSCLGTIALERVSR
jgi:hypothetical protein